MRRIGEHSGADEQLEVLPAFSQTTLYAACPEQDRDAALNACAEALSFFEGGTFLDGRAFGGLVSAALSDRDQFDAGLLASRAILRHPMRPGTGFQPCSTPSVSTSFQSPARRSGRKSASGEECVHV